MEALIVIVVIGLVVYLLYQSSPSTKFINGRKKFDSGNYIEAAEVFDSIFTKHPDAPAKLAECKLKQGLSHINKDQVRALRFFEDIVAIKKRLPANANKKLFELVEARANIEIISNRYNSILNLRSEDEKALEIESSLQSIDLAVKSGKEDEFSNLRLKHLTTLSECHFSIGKVNEKSNNMVLAINHYQKAKAYAEGISFNVIKYNAAARIGICTLKGKNQLNSALFRDIDNSHEGFKNDFYYRYAKSLLVQKNYSQAEKVVQENLNISSPYVDKIRALIKSVKTKNAIKQIEKINELVDKIYDNTFQIDEIRKEYVKLDSQIEDIQIVVPSLSEKLQQLKPALFNRIMMNSIEADDYIGAIELIQGYPTFYKNHELLKNLGICCFGITYQGGLTKKNYKTVISSWLTAVFSDKVILNSLNETSWDNDFTFTLLGAIGSKFNQHNNLPENVNYDEPSDTNISIGNTQVELLHQFEVVLQQRLTDKSLAELVHSFYADEKSSLEKIVSIVEKDILIPTPHFAKTFDLNCNIVEELDEKFYETDDEKILQAGVPYFCGDLDCKVGEYHNAQELISKIGSAIESKDLDELQNITSEENKELISEFPTIYGLLAGVIFNSFSVLIDEDDQDETIIDLMEDCLEFTDDNDKLIFQYTNYVANYSIQQVNEGNINNCEALSLMKKAYLKSDSNPRICKNLITIITNNLMDILNDSSADKSRVYSLLDDLYWHRSEVFMKFAIELSKTRLEILQKLKKSGAPVDLLTDETQFPLVSLSSTTRLTPEGEKMKRVLSYMKKISTSGFGELDDFSDTLQRLLRSRI